MERILIADDEALMRQLVADFLRPEGYEVLEAVDGKQALDIFNEQKPDLVLLDVMMPGYDGWTVCREIRRTSTVPIIMITAKDEEIDQLFAYDLGVDDYITKPFAVPELIARIRNALRRRDISTDDASDRLTVKNLIMFLSRYEVQVDGETVALTKREYDLLEYLLRNKRTVLTRDQILQEVWGFDYTGETNVVDVYIRYLRAKLDDRFHKKYIYTVRGVGYVVRD